MDFLCGKLNKADKVKKLEELKQIRENRLKAKEALFEDNGNISDADSNILSNVNDRIIYKRGRKRRRKLPKNKYIDHFASESDLTETDGEITEECSEEIVGESQSSDLMSMVLSDIESQPQIYTQDLELAENYDIVTRSMVARNKDNSLCDFDSHAISSNEEWKSDSNDESLNLSNEHSYSQNSSIVYKKRKILPISSDSPFNTLEYEHSYSQNNSRELNKKCNSTSTQVATSIEDDVFLNMPITPPMETNNALDMPEESQYRADSNSPELINLKQHVSTLNMGAIGTEYAALSGLITLSQETGDENLYNAEAIEPQEEVCSTNMDTDDNHSDIEEFILSANSSTPTKNEEDSERLAISDKENMSNISYETNSEDNIEVAQNVDVISTTSDELDSEQRKEGFDIITKYFKNLDCLANFAHHKRNDFKYRNKEIRNVRHLNRLSCDTLAFMDYLKEKLVEVREKCASELSTYFENNNVEMSESLSNRLNKNGTSKDIADDNVIDNQERNNSTENANYESVSSKGDLKNQFDLHSEIKIKNEDDFDMEVNQDVIQPDVKLEMYVDEYVIQREVEKDQDELKVDKEETPDSRNSELTTDQDGIHPESTADQDELELVKEETHDSRDSEVTTDQDGIHPESTTEQDELKLYQEVMPDFNGSEITEDQDSIYPDLKADQNDVIDPPLKSDQDVILPEVTTDEDVTQLLVKSDKNVNSETQTEVYVEVNESELNTATVADKDVIQSDLTVDQDGIQQEPSSMDVEFSDETENMNVASDDDNELIKKDLLKNSSSDSDGDEDISGDGNLSCTSTITESPKSNSDISNIDNNDEDGGRISELSDASTRSLPIDFKNDNNDDAKIEDDYKLRDNPFVKLIKIDLETMERFVKDSQIMSQDLEIKRLTNLNNLRRSCNSPSGSESDVEEKPRRKRRKISRKLLSDEETELSDFSSAEEFENRSNSPYLEDELVPENHNDYIKNILCDDTDSITTSSTSYSASDTEGKQIIEKAKDTDTETETVGNINSDHDSLSDSGGSADWRKDPLLTKKIDSDNKSNKSDKNKTLKDKHKDKDEDIEEKEVDESEEDKKSTKIEIVNSTSSDSDSDSLSGFESKHTVEYFFKQQQKMKKRRKLVISPITIENSSSDESTKKGDDDDDDDDDDDGDAQVKGRKNIREVISDEQLEEETKRAKREEDERIKRLTQKYSMMSQLSSQMSFTDEADENTLVLDLDPVTKKNLVIVHPLLSLKLKDHQREGVRFMWDNCYESLEKIKKEPPGKHRGCILAHCMGLGKTLQVIALVHTLLSHKECKTKKVLVVCPLSTVLNWEEEINRWLKPVQKKCKIPVFVLPRQKSERRITISAWVNRGGIFLISYAMFRILIRSAEDDNNVEYLRALIDPGPDLLICDEGHKIKNATTGTSRCLSKILTRRRILLTGTPMQNHLKEYYCMAHFVKPHLLGTLREFKNRFDNPIKNGLYKDSSKQDILLMKERSHVLHKILQGTVQRKEQSILRPYLPPKYEYVIFLGMSAIQEKMYKYYLTYYAQKLEECVEHSVQKKKIGANLLADHARLKMIWTHPNAVVKNLLYLKKEQQKKNKKTKTKKSSLDDDFEANQSEADDEPTLAFNGLIAPHASPPDWWKFIVTEPELRQFDSSTKAIILLDILSQCQETKEKVLVFSTALNVLNTLEEMLKDISDTGKDCLWIKGKDYFRLDGSVDSSQRFSDCATFNDPDNSRARLYLVSTKAGGLGINMIGASRVIILDTSWNPADEQQSIFRAYRLGQKKTVYVYRLLAQGTMEEKIYNRSVTKQAVSCRVVDEQQIHRHYSMEEYKNLYIFEPPSDRKAINKAPPTDSVLCTLINKHSFLYDYHEHDSLLQNVEGEELNEVECAKAWQDWLLMNAPPPQPLLLNTNMRLDQDEFLSEAELKFNKLYQTPLNLPSTSTSAAGGNTNYSPIQQISNFLRTYDGNNSKLQGMKATNELNKMNQTFATGNPLNYKNINAATVAPYRSNLLTVPNLSPAITMTPFRQSSLPGTQISTVQNVSQPSVINYASSTASSANQYRHRIVGTSQNTATPVANQSTYLKKAKEFNRNQKQISAKTLTTIDLTVSPIKNKHSISSINDNKISIGNTNNKSVVKKLSAKEAKLNDIKQRYEAAKRTAVDLPNNVDEILNHVMSNFKRN